MSASHMQSALSHPVAGGGAPGRIGRNRQILFSGYTYPKSSGDTELGTRPLGQFRALHLRR